MQHPFRNAGRPDGTAAPGGPVRRLARRGVSPGRGHRLIRFAAAGTVAGLVDMAVVQALVSWTATNPYSARLVSYLVAATVAWSLNRRFTFPAARRTGRAREWSRYLAVNLGGAAVNYGVYAALVLGGGGFAAWPAVAVAIGSLAGMLVNFTLVRRWVFAAA